MNKKFEVHLKDKKDPLMLSNCSRYQKDSDGFVRFWGLVGDSEKEMAVFNKDYVIFIIIKG